MSQHHTVYTWFNSVNSYSIFKFNCTFFQKAATHQPPYYLDSHGSILFTKIPIHHRFWLTILLTFPSSAITFFLINASLHRTSDPLSSTSHTSTQFSIHLLFRCQIVRPEKFTVSSIYIFNTILISPHSKGQFKGHVALCPFCGSPTT